MRPAENSHPMAGSTRRLLAVAGSAGLLSLLVLCSAAPEPAPVLVGAVLDLTSETGRKSLTCISMALDDFYAARANSTTTRVELRVRDSRGDVITAAYAADELINGKVEAIIISPRTSSEAELFADLAKRSHIPILSFSGSSPTSGPSTARFLVHTAANTNSQAAPIAAILEAFEWRAAVVLHEESAEGVGIVSALVHEFQGHGHSIRGVMDSVGVPADATDSRLDAVLLAAKKMPPRVFVVHMPSALAARLFHRAMAAGMVSEGYAWIATSAVGDEADGLSPGDAGCMQGVVSLRNHVEATDQARNFSRRFRVRFRQENLGTDDTVHDPSVPVWLLCSYDTVWALATAAETSRRATQAATALADALLDTRLHGLAGSFRLVDGQPQTTAAYEIVNVIGKGARTIGFWTPEAGISTSLYPRSGKQLKQVIWPGETAAVPTGWSETPSGHPLRVAVPVKRGFRQFVNISGDPRMERATTITGYCIDVFHAATAKLAYPVAYQYVPVNHSSESYDALVNLVHEKKVGAVVADVTITASRMKLVSFTVPFAESGWSMIVAEEEKGSSMWIFVKPLTPKLWLACVAFFIFTSFVVWLIELNPARSGFTFWKQFGLVFYFAFSTLVFSHREKLTSNLSRLVLIISVFAVFILTTSYTASLTSMLTAKPVRSAINILGERDYVGYQQGSFIAALLKDMGYDETKLRGYATMDEYADALKRGPENGGVSAIFDEMPYLRLFLSRYCKGYSMAGPTYKSAGFGFVFPMGSPLALDMSRAILELGEEEKLARFENKWFGHPGACVNGAPEQGGLDLRSFGGLFLTSVLVSCIMLLIHLSASVAADPAGAPGPLPHRFRVWIVNTLEGRRGANERNHEEPAAGEAEQAPG
ncbi:hypothetical protein ACQJBY_044417 [Aegilops geniculata]